MMKKRSLLGYIGLTIITCGLYHYYWIYVTTQDINDISGRKVADPAIALLLSLVTCGIYQFYWYYIVGNEMQESSNAMGVNIKENGTTYILFILLGMVTFGITSLIAYFMFFKNMGICVDYYNHNTMNNTYNNNQKMASN